MEGLQVLNVDGVSCYEEDGVAYLNLEDVAKGLGFVQIKNGVEYVKWERVKRYINSIGHSPQVGKEVFIAESVFYQLAMKAKNDTAREFQAKIANEIIPSIRKNGGYISGQEKLSDADLMARALMVAQKTIESRDALIAKQKPLVAFAEHVTLSENSIDIGAMAKIARKNNIDIGRNSLFKWMRKHRMLMRGNIPYQRYINQGLFTVVETRGRQTDKSKVFAKTMITGKGQIWLINKLRESYGITE